jgi:hypothetical protein
MRNLARDRARAEPLTALEHGLLRWSVATASRTAAVVYGDPLTLEQGDVPLPLPHNERGSTNGQKRGVRPSAVSNLEVVSRARVSIRLVVAEVSPGVPRLWPPARSGPRASQTRITSPTPNAACSIRSTHSCGSARYAARISSV